MRVPVSHPEKALQRGADRIRLSAVRVAIDVGRDLARVSRARTCAMRTETGIGGHVAKVVRVRACAMGVLVIYSTEVLLRRLQTTA